jgi:hypothetical protein
MNPSRNGQRRDPDRDRKSSTMTEQSARTRVQVGLRAVRDLAHPFFDPVSTVRAAFALPGYVRDLVRYYRMPDAEEFTRWRMHPVLGQNGAHTAFDAHYIYMGAWAFRHIVESGVREHVDVGGQVSWVTCLATVTPVTSIDIRTLNGEFYGLSSRQGSILAMPYLDRTVRSLSCLHVAEHIGLGRYGDPLDPLGTEKAIVELSRILAPSGALYFALPVGRAQLHFNAHRVLDPVEVVQLFAREGLTLRDFSVVDDHGAVKWDRAPNEYQESRYACGMFRLTRAPG